MPAKKPTTPPPPPTTDPQLSAITNEAYLLTQQVHELYELIQSPQTPVVMRAQALTMLALFRRKTDLAATRVCRQINGG